MASSTVLIVVKGRSHMNHKKYVFLIANIILAVNLLCISADVGFAQRVNLDSLTLETQQTSTESDRVIVIWWIPEEYWQVNLTHGGKLPPPQFEGFVRGLRPYTVFLVADGRIGTFGSITYRPEHEIRKSIQLVDSSSIGYPPVSNDKIDSDTLTALLMIKPALVTMLGPIGENMHFVLFPSKNKAGKQIAPATTEGAFSLKFGEREFKWKLPLGSLLPHKICPIDGEELNGAWKYCPWHGEKLSIKPNK
jgi:hypothetical protein